MKYSKNQLEKFYRMMLQIRLCEESLVEPINKGEIRCPVHLYSGQEAIATGLCSLLNKSDFIFGNHRSHGHYLAKGGDMTEMIAEIYGMQNGCSKGRGGSMHLISPENGVLGIVPIVAGTISLALGAALSQKIKNNKGLAVSFFGDGATGEGVLYESLNFASLKKLPIIFACENNFYSTHLPIDEIRTNRNIHKIAEPYGITNFRVEGNNLFDVLDVSEKAIEICRSGNGPVFIEFLTYRQRGHVGPDDNVQGTHTDIRPKLEIEEWFKKDPITGFEQKVIGDRIFNDSELQIIKKEVIDEVALANKKAVSGNKPQKEELFDYVYK